MARWIVRQTRTLGLEEKDSEGDGVKSPPLDEDDPMNMDNLIYNGPPSMIRLDMLAIVGLALGKNVSCV